MPILQTAVMEMGSDTQGHVQRYVSLDSLRGLAALTVVLHHCLVTRPELWAGYEVLDLRRAPSAAASPFFEFLTYSPAHLLWGGVEAVFVFFVLSGFVLSSPLAARPGQKPTYLEFAVKRLCRIYVPYLAAVSAAFALRWLLGPPQLAGLSGWSKMWWRSEATWGAALNHLFMLGLPDTNTWNPVIWSLVIELRVSLLFPLLVLFHKRTKGGLAIIAVTAASFVSKLALSSDLIQWIPLKQVLDTLQYLFLFSAGIELFEHRKAIQKFALTTGARWRLPVLAIALLGINSRWWVPGTDLGPVERLLIYLAVSASAITLVAVLSTVRSDSGFWQAPSMSALGRVSYSLYLVHFPILMAALVIGQRLGIGGWLVLAVPACSIAAAILFHRWFEVPAQALGNRLAVKIRERLTGHEKDGPFDEQTLAVREVPESLPQESR